MDIGIPKERLPEERRVGLTPAAVSELTSRAHRVFVEHDAGAAAGHPDGEYVRAGATVVQTPAGVWAQAELIVKVKEPTPEEYPWLRDGQTLFTYLHLAASESCTRALVEAGITAIAYETVRDHAGRLPLLTPMSEIAGRMAAQVGAHLLQGDAGGPGILLGGAPGVPPAQVAILGAGVSGTSAAEIALGMGAEVTLLDLDIDKLRRAEGRLDGRLRTVASTVGAIQQAVAGADLVIGAVLVAGARAPVLVDDALVARMAPGSVLVDIAVDQGGCFASTRPTTHARPTFQVGQTTFYCVANMPGAVARTATQALTSVTLPYVLRLAELGWQQACSADPGLAAGLNVHAGTVVHAGVAAAHAMPCRGWSSRAA